jgi:hypothetical protein
MYEGEKKPTIPIKRRDVGIAGLVIVLAEIASNFQSSSNVASEIVKFKEEFQASKVEREIYFVRKTELEALSNKLEKLTDQLSILNNQVVSLRTFLKSSYGYEASEGRLHLTPAICQCDEEEDDPVYARAVSKSSHRRRGNGV